ncbi:adenylyltransferase/cytidyltransferase family protein [Bradyrhizobium sp. SZCCHNRI20481]|uniref:adenylyltransferase/cytidyltransferase family protein n=1 Tax=Bradyrhizobium sp. SZCCHNRI20481 TaxID=3057286 RepID=UPI00291658BE|nr:adenylyltransferase/cytidyltransferase family protein [Bradyrhizobium sp. SZCCHNRI20481]
MTFGTFDLFHIGHLRLLERSAALGDRLVVCVSSDQLVLSRKGRLPLFSEQQRMDIVRSIRCVDKVFVEEAKGLKRHYLLEHRADVVTMGDDYTNKFDEFNDIVEVVYLKRTPDISTTDIVAQIRSLKPAP